MRGLIRAIRFRGHLVASFIRASFDTPAPFR